MSDTDPLTAALEALEALKTAVEQLGNQRDYYCDVAQDAASRTSAVKRAQDVHE